jgi:hypothetical protein
LVPLAKRVLLPRPCSAKAIIGPLPVQSYALDKKGCWRGAGWRRRCAGAAWRTLEDPRYSNAKILFQSFFMLMTVQPFFCASS